MTINVIADVVLLDGIRVAVLDRTAIPTVLEAFVEQLLGSGGMDVDVVADDVRFGSDRVATLDLAAIPTVLGAFVELLQRRRAQLLREDWAPPPSWSSSET